MSQDSIVNEARSRVLWGEDLEPIRQYLRDNAIAEDEAEAAIAEALAERHAEVRGRAVKMVLIGAGLLIVPTALYLIFFRQGMYNLVLVGTAITCLLFGLWKLGDGLRLFGWPQSFQGPLSEY